MTLLLYCRCETDASTKSAVPKQWMGSSTVIVELFCPTVGRSRIQSRVVFWVEEDPRSKIQVSCCSVKVHHSLPANMMSRFMLLMLALLAHPCLVASFLPRSSVRSARQRALIVTGSSSSTNNAAKEQLLDLLAAVPRNKATSRRQTQDILHQVRQLEPSCPTNPADVLPQLAGTWELLWTAQDRQSSDDLSAFRWINPLENQAYSNNPQGRANAVLPLDMQQALTDRGLLSDTPEQPTTGRRSTQTIDLKNQRVINVVSLNLPQQSTATLTVSVKFTPDAPDARRVNVKFDAFAVKFNKAERLNLPLGLLGPTGWLRTTYIDDDLRVTRGHKGSVFVLRRQKTGAAVRSGSEYKSE